MYYSKKISIAVLFIFFFFGCSTTSNKAVNSPKKNALLDDSFTFRPAAYSSDRGDPAKSGKQKNGFEETTPALDEALEYCQASQDFWQKGEFDNAIQALDQAYSLIINDDNRNTPKRIQAKDDLRFLISKRILEIYASRNIVVTGNHNEIPIIINNHVQKEIDRFTKGRDRSFFIASYKRSGRFRPYIVQSLQEAGLPVELSWLPLIESGYKTKALSKARALGLWQFIPSTGYKFGLKRDLYIDERLDPEKSTQAAIDYMSELHKIFGDWTTVLAAYNCGEGRVLRIIRSQNVNYLDNFWDLYQRLPRETARYVPKFLATLHIVNNLEKYGLDKIELAPPLEYKTVEISRQVYLKSIGKKIGVSADVLNKLNPELRYKMLPQCKYDLKIPPGQNQLVLSKIDEIPIPSPPRKAFVYHRVRRGESLSTIARKYRTNVKRIARANNINKRNFIVTGKLLKIPQGRSYIPKTRNFVVNYSATTHIVKRGDSLWIIAKKYDTTTKKIKRLNNITSSNLHVGQTLKLPGRKNNAAYNASFKSYRVKKGDSPFTIARNHKMPLNRLLRINRLNSTTTIFPGQQLYVE